MILLLDIGNTYTKLAVYDLLKNKIKKKINIKTIDLLNKNFLLNLLKKEKFKYSLCSSVVPKIYQKLKTFLSNKSVKIYEISQKVIKKNIKIKIKDKKQLGSDRISNSIAAKSLGYKNVVIVDFGTATTFDIINKSDYIGGIIFPGINLSIEALGKLTAKLPIIKLKKNKRVIGKNTFEAINSGIYWGYISMINGLLWKINKVTNKKNKLILTGGYSKFFKSKINTKSTLNPDITLLGLITLIKRNKKIFDVNK